jgi:hypothetical protein
MLEDESLPLLRGEPSQRLPEATEGFRALDGGQGVGPGSGDFPGIFQTYGGSLGAEVVFAGVGQDPEQPRPHALGVTAGAELSVSLDQGFLHQIGGLVPASHDPDGVPKQDVAVPSHQKPIGIPVTGKDIPYHLSVGAFSGTGHT